MTSRRSSRVYADETLRRQDLNTNTLAPKNTFGSSRSSSRDSMAHTKVETEDAVLIQDEMTVVHSESAAIVSKETSSSSNSTRYTEAKSIQAISMGSHPSAPTNGRPVNFGIVVPGVYRSNYPVVGDFEYIKSLGLKTLVTLVKKDEPDHELESFVTQNGIRQIVFNMKGTKKEAIPLKTMKSILSVVLNKDNYPLLIHCNHGKHRTGCVVAVVRKLSGWRTQTVLDEYKTYAEPKARECDIDYISAFQVTTLRSFSDDKPSYSPVQIRAFFRVLLLSAFVMVVWLVSGMQMNTAMRQDSIL